MFYMGVNHGRIGGRDESLLEFEVGEANANCPPIFCHVLKFYAPHCLHYNAVMH